MKLISFLSLILFSSLASTAQTPIDDLQKQNISYLETLESQGYEFRSEIITEFDEENASQNVNIKLSKDYTYIIVALGDSNIPSIELDIKPTKNTSMKSLELDKAMTGQSIQLNPSKSGQFKIAINAKGLDTSTKGFISFMVLRK